jgi:hypothetical protein
MASNILVDALTQPDAVIENDAPAVVGWVVDKVTQWEDHRNENYQKRWNEYYRLWRGTWTEEDKTRQVERSKIIAPALQQAIESSVAEMEESIFHRKRWFSLEDDKFDRETQEDHAGQMQDVIDNLLEDFDKKKVPQAISEIILNGALYGTGIGKIPVTIDTDLAPGTGGIIVETKSVGVGLVAVDPSQFVIDTAATTIENALGMAHVYTVPLHEVLRKQAKGEYRDGFVGTFNEAGSKNVTPELLFRSNEINQVEVIEYHGLVPKSMFDDAVSSGDKDDQGADDSDLLAMSLMEPSTPDDAGDMVECIIWISGRATLLKVVRNPFIMRDRSFVSFQYDTVPNRFWGRGVAEKGYNPQKALDTELRARIDSLALSTYPMLLINGMMAPRNQDYQVRPGRNLVVNGNVGEAIAPFKFPAPDGQTYRQTAELERMVTVATGSLDSAAPLGVNPRNETASGISMMLSAVLKRSKRTMRNIEGQFLSPLVHKHAWRHMQFNPTRYKIQDYKFKVVGALGAQAREFEVAQLTQLLQTQKQEGPGYWMILKGVLKNYNLEDKEDFMKLIDQFLQQSLNPQPPPTPPDIEIKMKELERKNRELDFKIDQAVEGELRKDVEVEAEAARDRGEAIWNASEASLNARKAETERVKALGALIQQMAAAAGQEGADLQAILSQAQGIVEESVQFAKGQPEAESLRTSMARQQEEEGTPGIPAQEIPEATPQQGQGELPQQQVPPEALQ